MRRKKEPNLGLWVAPGGKIEAGEAPFECATRELKEEAGLSAQATELRGVVSIVMPKLTTPMIHFLYLVSHFSGDLTADTKEGDLCWHTYEGASNLAMPTANTLFLAHVLNPRKPFYQARYSYDADWGLVEVLEHDLVATA